MTAGVSACRRQYSRIKALPSSSHIDTDIFRAIQMAAIAAFEGPRITSNIANNLYIERLSGRKPDRTS